MTGDDGGMISLIARRSTPLQFEVDPNEEEELVVVGRHAVHLETGKPLRFPGGSRLPTVDRFVWGALRGMIEIKILHLKKWESIWHVTRFVLLFTLFMVGMVVLVVCVVFLNLPDNAFDDDDDDGDGDDDDDGVKHKLHLPPTVEWTMYAILIFYGLLVQWTWTRYEKRKTKEGGEKTKRMLESIVADIEFPHPDYSAVIADATNRDGWSMVKLLRRRRTDDDEVLWSEFSPRRRSNPTTGMIGAIEIPVREFLSKPPSCSSVVDLWTWGGLKLALDDERLRMERCRAFVTCTAILCFVLLPQYLVRYHQLDSFPALAVTLCMMTTLVLYSVYEEHRVAPNLHQRCTAAVVELSPAILEHCHLHVSYHVKRTRWRRTQGVLRFQEDVKEEEDDDEAHLLLV